MKCYAYHTGQTMEKVAKDCNRDYWMTADGSQRLWPG